MTKLQMIRYIEETVHQLDSMDNLEMYYEKKERFIDKLKSIEYIEMWRSSFETNIRQWNVLFDMCGESLKHNLEMRTHSRNKIYYKGLFGKKMIYDVIFIFSL